MGGLCAPCQPGLSASDVSRPSVWPALALGAGCPRAARSAVFGSTTQGAEVFPKHGPDGVGRDNEEPSGSAGLGENQHRGQGCCERPRTALVPLLFVTIVVRCDDRTAVAVTTAEVDHPLDSGTPGTPDAESPDLAGDLARFGHREHNIPRPRDQGDHEQGQGAEGERGTTHVGLARLGRGWTRKTRPSYAMGASHVQRKILAFSFRFPHSTPPPGHRFASTRGIMEPVVRPRNHQSTRPGSASGSVAVAHRCRLAVEV
jgi:hypothetical protein